MEKCAKGEKMEIINQIKNLKNMYDLLALCCLVTMQQKPDYDFNNVNIFKYAERLEEIFSIYDVECEREYKKRAFEHFKVRLKEYLEEGTEPDKLFAIALEIDNRIKPIVVEKHSTASKFLPYYALNKQYCNKICIIPRTINSFLDKVQSVKNKEGYSPLRERRENNQRGIDYKIKNYYIWDQQDIKNNPLTIYRVSKNSTLYSHFSNRMQISIGIVPLTCKNIENIFDIVCEQGKFEITGIKEKEKKFLSNRYENIYERTKGRELDFLIFPEMLMTDDILDYIKTFINKNAFLTINGSIWKDGTNKSVLTDVQGEEVLSYLKKAWYIHKKDGKAYQEHLDTNKNKGYVILEIENYGRIGIAICKDLLSLSVREIYKRLNINLLFVPAYSHSLDLQSESRELAEQLNCIVVVTNSCGALEDVKGKDIGFLCLPAIREKDRDSIIKKYNNQCCYKNCNNGCEGKIFSIHFDKFLSYEGYSSFKVMEDEEIT